MMKYYSQLKCQLNSLTRVENLNLPRQKLKFIAEFFKKFRISRNTLTTFGTHYCTAMAAFQGNDNSNSYQSEKFFEEEIISLVEGDRLKKITPPANLLEIINRIHKEVCRRFEQTENCTFFPEIPKSKLPVKTAEIPELIGGKLSSIQLINYLGIDGVEELASALIPQIEEKIFHSHVVVDRLEIIRNLKFDGDDTSSWKWHYDNFPDQILKLMIYLTDVGEDNAPFEYFFHPTKNHPVNMSPTPKLGNGRITKEAIERFKEEGFHPIKLIGKRGTMALFRPNIVHKANYAKARHRDALFFCMRPIIDKKRPHIDARWTGSYLHVTYPKDPECLDLVIRPDYQRYLKS